MKAIILTVAADGGYVNFIELSSCRFRLYACHAVTIGQFRGKHGVVKVRRLPVHKLNWVKTRSLCYISAFNCLKINY